MNSMPPNFLEIFWPTGAEIAIGYFLGLFKFGYGVILLAANNSLINELKNCEKIFSDSKKANLFHDKIFFGMASKKIFCHEMNEPFYYQKIFFHSFLAH